MVTITQRCLNILKLICNKQGPITVKQIAGNLGVSERTARYDLSLLHDWLAEKNVTLMSVPKKGSYFEDHERTRAQLLLTQYSTTDQSYGLYLNADERVNRLILRILHEQEEKAIDDLSEELGISRATFVRDMEKAENWFELHQVTLQRGQKKGVHLDADEITRRSLIVAFILENTSIHSFLNSCWGRDPAESKPVQDYCAFFTAKQLQQSVDFDKLFQMLDDYLSHIQIAVTDNTVTWLIYYVAVMAARIKEGKFIEILPDQYEQFVNTDAYSKMREVLKEQFFGNIDEANLNNEAVYIVGRLFAAATNIKDTINEENSEIANRIYQFILSKIRQHIGYDMRGSTELADGLKTHLQASLVRAQLNISTSNAMLDEIKRKFPDLFETCSSIADEVNEMFHLHFDENEVGFIVLYIVAAMEQMHKTVLKPTMVRAVLVCGYGLGTVSLLTNSLEKHFPSIEIVDKLSILTLNRYDFSNVDVVLSTVDIPLTLLKPTIKVSPMITKLDERKIDSFLRNGRMTAKNNLQEFQMTELLNIIGNNCEIRNNEKLMEELEQMMRTFADVPPALTSLPALPDVLLKKYIVAQIEAETWEEAVLKAAQPLLENNCITMEYIDRIIGMKNTFGQYSIIAPGVCMPHATPCENAKLAMSLATLKKPVRIIVEGETVDISVFMVLSLVDSITHAKALDEVFLLLDEFPNLVDELKQATKSADISNVFKTYYNKLF